MIAIWISSCALFKATSSENSNSSTYDQVTDAYSASSSFIFKALFLILLINTSDVSFVVLESIILPFTIRILTPPFFPVFEVGWSSLVISLSSYKDINKLISYIYCRAA